MSFFVIEVAAGITVILLSTLVAFLYKLPATLDQLNEHLKKTESSLLIHGKRLDVHDALWSTHLRRSVNSSMIALGEAKLPDPVEKNS